MSDRRPTRILNVNDREIPRYLHEQMLLREGFEVVSVATGEDAVRVARGDFELVLLDVQLPDISGFEVCRRIKADPASAGISVLLSSATFVGSHNKVTGLDSGADGYLAQPFEVQELVATIRALIRTRHAEREAHALAQELRDAMAVRDEFLAMLGHELRNPIGAMSTALHLVRDARDPATLDRYVPVLDRQTKNLARIVDDILDVARITQGKVRVDSEVVDLRVIAERCRDTLGSSLLGAPHELEITVEGPPTSVLGDPVRLEQILTNLLTNAVKYTPSRGRVAIRLAHEGPLAAVRVTDTGIGMDEETRARVFDVFAQGQTGIARSRGGLGLGLTVARQLVELHGGTIDAESDGPGKGSTFVVRLPRVDAEEPDQVTLVPEDEIGLDGTRILVIEDNDDAREALGDLLEAYGATVARAADGRVGLDLALSWKPDVMLVDVGLPIVDGYHIAREIAPLPDRPALLAMTGYGQPEDRVRAEEAGFDLHLVKPVSPDDLLVRLMTIRKKRG